VVYSDYHNLFPHKEGLIKQISDLTLKLAQSQTEAAQMMNELQTLKAEAEKWEHNPLHYTGSIYRDPENYPYCPACYDGHKKRIHLTKHKTIGHSFHCPICKENYGDDD
jgi:phage regulator Rha-like protein